MLLTTLALVQGDSDKESEGIQRRRIYEAALAAEYWAFVKSNELCPGEAIAQNVGARRRMMEREKEACRRDLTLAACRQVCEAYHVSMRTMFRIVADPALARSSPFVPDVQFDGRAKAGLEPWHRKGTLFSSRKVRLPENLAKRYGYENPRVMEGAKARTIMERLTERAGEPDAPTGPAIPDGPTDGGPGTIMERLERRAAGVVTPKGP